MDPAELCALERLCHHTKMFSVEPGGEKASHSLNAGRWCEGRKHLEEGRDTHAVYSFKEFL